MKRISRLLLFLFAALSLWPLTAQAQQATALPQVSLSRWNIGSANFSGITSLGGGRYALVSDKEPRDGFFVFQIEQDVTTGKIISVSMEGFCGDPNTQLDSNGLSVRDTEGIAYFPARQTLFISGETHQDILEYDLLGIPTGRKMQVPDYLGATAIVGNYGFEALTYDSVRNVFWTITESTLLADGIAAGPKNPGGHNLLRLQAFDTNLQPCAQYPYRMDRGRSDDFGPTYVYGVPAITALPDGRLLLLEREANITNGYLASDVRCKIFAVNPSNEYQIDASTNLQRMDNNRWMTKQLLVDFTTKLTPFNLSFANYEGMCLGCRLNDGRQTVLLISDSQGGFRKGPIYLRDFLKVIVLPN